MARIDSTISSIILSLHPEQIGCNCCIPSLSPSCFWKWEIRDVNPSPPWWGSRQIALEGLLSQRPNEAQACDMKGIGSHAIAQGHTQGLRFGVSAVVVQVVKVRPTWMTPKKSIWSKKMLLRFLVLSILFHSPIQQQEKRRNLLCQKPSSAGSY